MPSSLVADASALVENFAAGHQQLLAFAEAHPVEAIYSELSSPSAAASPIDAASVAVVARALAKVFADAELASDLLPETCPFAVTALRSSESPEQLRALAAEALGSCVAAGVGGEGEETSPAASALVAALGDSSAAVGAAAERGGRIAASTEVGTRAILRAGLVAKMSLSGGGQDMEEGSSTSPALARARALSVAAAALAAGRGPAAALKAAGAFAAVSEQLSLQSASDDPLSAASALATISDAVSSVLGGGRGGGGGSEGGGGGGSEAAARAAAVCSLLAAEVGRPLARLLASSSAAGAPSPKVAFAVRTQAMQTAAKLVAAAVGGRGSDESGGEGNGAAAAAANNNGNANSDADSTDAAAVAAAPSASSSPIPSPASPVGGLAAALLASIERSLDEEVAVGRDGQVAAADDADEEASATSEDEASLLALAELASTAGGAALVAAASPDALNDAARIALGGRGGASCRLAALHALASVAGVERMRRERRRGEGRGQQPVPPPSPSQPAGVLLPGAGESVLASALHRGASSAAAARAGGSPSPATPAGALLSLVLLGTLPDEKAAALRLALALAARPWGAAEVAMHSGLLGRLVDVSADAATPAAEWRHAVCVALSEALERVFCAAAGENRAPSSSSLGPTQLSALAAARPAIEAAVRAGPHGIGGPAPRFVATRAAN